VNTIGIIGIDASFLLIALGIRHNNVNVICYDEEDDLRKIASKSGLVTTSSVQAVLLHLATPKIVWITRPMQKEMDALIYQLADLLDRGDIVIDTTPALEHETAWRHELLNSIGIGYLKGRVNKTEVYLQGDVDAFYRCKPLFGEIEDPFNSINYN
jgi:6-phosphogluconate dehydrogenase